MKSESLGTKILSGKNWKTPDLPSFTNGLRGSEWIGLVIAPKLGPAVPEEIKGLFEVARAAFAYAWYFMPLTQLGAEQCHRVVETAVREKCEKLGIPVQIRNSKGKVIATTFKANIAALAKQGAISSADELKWDITRRLRNRGAHPESQTILPPGFLVGELRLTAEQINSLFP